MVEVRAEYAKGFEEGLRQGVTAAVNGVLDAFCHDTRCGPCPWTRLLDRIFDQAFVNRAYVNSSEDGEDELEFTKLTEFTPDAASHIAMEVVNSLPPVERPPYVERQAESDEQPINLMTPEPEMSKDDEARLSSEYRDDPRDNLEFS